MEQELCVGVLSGLGGCIMYINYVYANMALFCVLSFKFNIPLDVSQHENLHIDWNGKLVLNKNNLSMLTDYKVIHLHHKGESSLTYVLV